MKSAQGVSYEVVRSRRRTADIVIERDGNIVVRAPEWADDEKIDSIVAAKNYWIFQGLAEWRDLNATRVLREYKNGEGFSVPGTCLSVALGERSGGGARSARWAVSPPPGPR